MDKTCVVGTTDLDFDAIKTATKVTLDGATGKVWIDIDVPVVDSSDSADVRNVMNWALAQQNMSEQVALIPAVVQPHTTYKIMVAEWWGSEEVLHATLNELSDMTSAERANFVLELDRPTSFAPPEDNGLASLFGELPEEVSFLTETIVPDMLANAEHLAGLKISYASSATEKAVAPLIKHFPFHNAPAAPADYATHSVLS